MHIVCALFPNLTQLDLTGPYEVFHRAPGASVRLAAASLDGENVPRAIQLGIEYDPAPPFDSGSPDRADPGLVRAVTARLERMQVTREDAVRLAASRIGKERP